MCVCGEVGEKPNKCRKRDILQDPTDQDEHVEWLVVFFFSFILSSFTCFHPGRWLKTGAGAGACLRARHTCAETRGHWQDGIVHRVLQTSGEALWPIGGYFYTQRTPPRHLLPRKQTCLKAHLTSWLKITSGRLPLFPPSAPCFMTSCLPRSLWKWLFATFEEATLGYKSRRPPAECVRNSCGVFASGRPAVCAGTPIRR